MANIFNSIRLTKPTGSKFDLSYENRLTAKFGELIPFFHQEVLPGDAFKVGQKHLIRMAPTLAPLMQQVDVYMHYFFVPNRLLWDDWQDFISNVKKSGSSSLPVRPTLQITIPKGPYNNLQDIPLEIRPGSLYDYFGFPTINEPPSKEIGGVLTNIDALPFRAYALIYNEYYRDQNLTAEIEFSHDGGPSAANESLRLMKLQRRAWLHDYFTSALPWPQYGTNPVNLPFGSGEVYYNPSTVGNALYGQDGTSDAPKCIIGSSGNGGYLEGFAGSSDADQGVVSTSNLHIDNSKDLKVRFTSQTVPSVVDIRRAFKVQEWLERQAIGGSRYIEQIFSHFGVRSSDARLQRPEYLCGLKSPLIMSEVQQTGASKTTESGVVQEPLGMLAGNATSAASNFAFSRRFEEHGQLIGILSVMPKSAYFQGVPRKFSRESWDEYFWPEFANIGEQAIRNKELYFDFSSTKSFSNKTDTDSNKEFGYAPRYAEYRYNPNEVHGEFRSSLRFWHMARSFKNGPMLNTSFITYDNANVDNVLAVSSDVAHPLYCQIYNQVEAFRLIPKYADPHL
nr:MAG: major capsid protein [Microviridae sp.]